MNQQIQEATPIKVISGAVKVKEAHLMQIGEEGHNEEVKYVLQHYDTIILEVVNGEILIISKISVSSTRAINQALEYLMYSIEQPYKGKTAQEIVKQFKKKGKFVKESRD